MANTYTNTDWSADSLTKATATSSTVDNVALGGTLTVTGANTLSSTLAVTGATTLSSTLTVSGASQFNQNVTVGVNDTGYDVKFFGATSGSYMLWDESDDTLTLTDATKLQIGDSLDLRLWHDTNSYILNYTGDIFVSSATGTTRLGTTTSGIPVLIGHTTSETTVNDNLTVTGDLTLSSNVIKASDGGSTITLDTSDNVAIGNNLKVGGNVIQASDGGSTITMDTSDNVTIAGDLTVTGNDIKGSGGTAITMDGSNNVTIAGDLTVTGGDIDLSGEASQITLIDNTSPALQIGSTGALALISINTNNDAEMVNFQHTHAATTHSLKISGLVTLTDNADSAGAGGIRFDPAFVGNYTVTSYSYLQFDEVALVSSAAITNTQAFSFPANAGTHPAVDSGSAHPDIDTTDAWIRVLIGSTVHYIPAYTDKS